MLKTEESAYNIKIASIEINTKDVFKSLQNLSFDKATKKATLDITINEKTYSFTVIKENKNDIYQIMFDKETIILEKKIAIFKLNSIEKVEHTYCFDNLIAIIKLYDIKTLYINKKNKIKININMEDDIDKLKSLYNKEKQIIIEKDEVVYENLITKDIFELHKDYKFSKYDEKNFENTLYPKYFDKYTTKYIEGLKENEKLLYLKNDEMDRFHLHIEYYDHHEDELIFKFITGPKKIGKTFSLLCLNRMEKKDYIIYLNDKLISELNSQKKYEEIKNIFFYEISKIFHTYDEYLNFSKSFMPKINENLNKKFDFKGILFKFIEEIELFIKDNEEYNKLELIFDDFELDERNIDKFNSNLDIINTLYNKRFEKSLIHFTFVSPINNNYIQKCVSFCSNDEDSAFIKKDENKKITYYPFLFQNTCFYDPACDYEVEEYKKKINEINKASINIPENDLITLNYSIYHINNIKNMCSENLDKENISLTLKEYINNLENDGENIIQSFYKPENYLYIYDLDKVKKNHELIKKGVVKPEEFLEILDFIPIEFLSFYFEYDLDLKIPQYKISYIYEFYENSISKYIESFENQDKDIKNKKPGKKGDIFEEKVIEAIRNGYFSNFKPDITIELNDIFELSQYNKNPNKFNDIIEKFEELFIKKDWNLAMITQEKSNAKKYDVAFIQQFEKGKFQFILSQITTKKDRREMLPYTTVKSDCYNFSDFFALFNGIEMDRYHFFFVFKSGLNEDSNSMSFCINNDIKFIKFCELDKKPIFTNSLNKIIDKLVFDLTNFSLVECIKNRMLKDDNSSSSSEFSLIGIKRTRVNAFSKAKYAFGITIYKTISNLLEKKDFELSKDYYALEEDKYFYVHYRKENKKNVYYLEYLKNGVKIIKNIQSKDKNEIVSEEEIKKPGTKFKCFNFKIQKEN